ncbi:hypothetical protein TWF718_004948 [Orbilia javanica]|uniref:Uncharacterized protein n=1 Tax=Orbilia javanica TaxID=47235 RepID=A0AAN8RLI2_9PEZI
MAPYKPILLLSLLFSGTSHAHWIPFLPDVVPEPISNLGMGRMGSRQDDPNHLHPEAAEKPARTLTSTASITAWSDVVTRVARSDPQATKSSYTSMSPNPQFPQLALGANNSFASDDSYTSCAYGTSSCEHVGKPDICCPDILIISPIQVTLENSCFKTERSPLGVICCQDPVECERVEHHPDEYPTYELTCNYGFHSCPASLGGGCCPLGLSCGSDNCYESIGNDTYTGPLGDDDPRETDYIPLPPNIATAIGLQTAFPYPTGEPEPRYRVRKIGLSVLKTGEIEECVGPQCENLDSGLDNEVGQAIQNVAEGSNVILTLTQQVSGVSTHAPGIPNALSQGGGPGGGAGSGLIGPGLPLHSGGSSFVRRGLTGWTRILSSGHIQYLALSLILNGFIGMGLDPA